jgi:sulfoquinovosidase
VAGARGWAISGWLVPLGLLLAPHAAAAAISVGPNSLVVSAPAASAVVTLDPFRIVVRDSRGAASLAEVPNAEPVPSIEPPTADPLPPGSDNPSTKTLYAPLSFLVGTETLQQYQGLVWGGNPMSGERSGVLFSARRVLSWEREGGGVRLVVATSDPTGRRLIVTAGPLRSAAIRISVTPDPATGVVEMGDSFASGPDEAFFGFGGRHDLLDRRGQVFSSFVEEENLDGLGGQPSSGSLSLFPNGPPAAYYPQAQFISSRPYGFLLDQPELARFKLDSDSPDAWNVTASAAHLDYVVAPGAAPQAIATLTALNGRQPAPPRWALGPMLDRLVKNVGESESDYEQQVSRDLANIARYRLPLRAYRLEGWGFPGAGNDGFALPTQMSARFQAQAIARLRRRRIHPLVYLRPFITPGSAPERQGLVVRTSTGAPYRTTGTTGQQIELLDFTNPAAVAFWQAEVRKALDLGADGFMQDFGEEILDDMHFADAQTGVTMHNRYPILSAEATRQAFTAYARSHPHRSLFFFTRAGYSGLPGSAAFEGGNFPGDETTDWTHSSGLGSLTTDMLSRAIGGAYGYGTDIGGYFDYTSPPTTKELFLRWAEWAALTPVFRLHGSGRSGTHTPWSYDAQTVRAYIALSRLHLAAVPLIMKLWRQADRTGMPVTRPLWLGYPADPRARTQDQEWLLGPDVLVAPVVTQGAVSRQVYFPSGCWRAPAGHKRYHGPVEATLRAPLTVLPYFFRCGKRPFAAVPAAR